MCSLFIPTILKISKGKQHIMNIDIFITTKENIATLS